MGTPISVRLDDEVRSGPEAKAKHDGIGLATLLRDLANRVADEARRARIRHASERVGARAAACADGSAFYEEWGAPASNGA